VLPNVCDRVAYYLLHMLSFARTRSRSLMIIANPWPNKARATLSSDARVDQAVLERA